jgi:hypothetical protein
VNRWEGPGESGLPFRDTWCGAAFPAHNSHAVMCLEDSPL